MRNTLLIFFAGIFQLYASDSYSQNTRLTLDLNSVPVANVLDKIESNSEFYFLFNAKLIDVKREVSISVEDKKISDILESLFSGTGVNFKVFDRQIILTPDDVTALSDVMQQQQKVTGTVTDKDGAPLPGVNVVVTGKTQGTLTDVSGKYSIEIPMESKSLTFSFIGMVSQEIIIGTLTQINVTMIESATALEEVVVIGYGTVKKSDLTGSVSSIKEDEINLQAVRNPIQSLTGLVPGVNVLQNSGAPGSNLSVLIRGGNSLIGGNEPLYVVDGFPLSGKLDIINPNDIQSMEILKDASATAIYGSRGANGVVIITTKEGKSGKTSIEYNGYYGIQKVTKRLDMLNAKEFATLANFRATNDGVLPYFSDSEIAALGEGTNWQDEIIQPASIQNHSLSISGGNDKTRFNVSSNYFGQEGIIINSDFKRYQLRTNLEHKINPSWKISLNNVLNRTATNNIYSDNTTRGYGVLSSALTAAPTLTAYNEQGNYTDMRQYVFSDAQAENPVALALEQKDLQTENSFLLNLSLEGSILKNFIFKSSAGVEYNNLRRDYYSSTKLIKSLNGAASISYDERTYIVNENILTYSKEIGANHILTILGGLTVEKSISQSVKASSNGFLTNEFDSYSLQSGSSIGIPTSDYIDYSMLSFLTRINYTYKGKYLFTSSIRADGSSRFGVNEKWGYFPSVALAWRVSEEDFWNSLEKVNNFKIRGSVGKTGNTAISPYQSLSTLSSVPIVLNDNLYLGYAPGLIKPNPSLKWETTNQFDVGMDLGFFNDKLSFTIDYYYKKTFDLLSSITLPSNTGYSIMIGNIGSIQNKGFEISSNLKLVKGIFSWGIGANISVNRNKVLSLSQGTDVYGSSVYLPLNVSVNLAREGYPIGVFYGYKEDGLTEDGKIKYVDYDSNGLINTLDQVIIGDPNPDYIFGVNSIMSFKNFDLKVLMEGVQGNDIFNNNNSFIADGFAYAMNNLKDVLGNYWTMENPNPNAKYPIISANTRYQASQRYIEDGSYIKIKNIQLSYTFKGERFISSAFNNSQIYLGIQNLITFTKYSGFSPEVNTLGAGISKGVDQAGYPVARIVMLGVEIKFQ